MDILSANERVKLQGMKSEFLDKAQFNKMQKVDKKEMKEAESRTASLLSAIDSFGSEKFVVTCIGMLKSGKSTLINLLSHNESASPTGFGFDTTLRPALITYTNESQGSIEVWLPAEQDAERDDKNILNEVFACLRGIKKPEEVEKATHQIYPLTEANLKNALCKKVLTAEGNMLPAEPVMVVVKVPGHQDSMLNEEITILDTPGLDSGESAWTEENSERYNWIIEHSDLILFLQSSVAPLNQKAKTVLKMIHERKPKTPIFLIQNEMIVKPWYSEDVIRNENKEQRAKAAEMFDQVNKTFKKLYANLGKANTALFDDDYEGALDAQQLLDESQFHSLKIEIASTLQQSSGPIRRRNCIENVKRESCDLTEQLFNMQKKLEEQKKEIETQANTLNEEWEDFKDLIFDPPQDKIFQVASSENDIRCKDTISFQNDFFLKILHDAYELEFKEEKYSAEQLQNLIRKIKENLISKMQEKLRKVKLTDFLLNLQVNGEVVSNLPKYILKLFRNHIISLKNEKKYCEELVSQIEFFSGKMELPPLPEELGVDIYKLDRITVNISRLKHFFNKIWEWVDRDTEEAKEDFLVYYNPETKTGKFAELIDDCQKEMIKKLFVWINRISYELLREQFTDKLDRQISTMVNNRIAEAESLDKDLETVKGLIDASEKLKEDMEVFER